MARKCYEVAADQNHPSALYNLGQFFQLGNGVQQDFQKAFSFYLAAARNGHAMSQLLVGQTLSRGLYGIEADESEGFAWMQRAAENGIVEAEAQIGFMFMAGLGTSKNQELADYWHRRAAMKGHAWAQYRLAYSIIRTEGAEQAQLIEAAKWLILSFNEPEEPGEKRHELIQGDWSYLSATLSPADLEEAGRQANAEFTEV